MRNIFINNYRRMARTATVVDRSEDLYQINLSGQTSFETPEGSVTVHEITAVINSFSDEFKVPFSLHLAGYKYAEIAKRTGLPFRHGEEPYFLCSQEAAGKVERLQVAVCCISSDPGGDVCCIVAGFGFPAFGEFF